MRRATSRISTHHLGQADHLAVLVEAVAVAGVPAPGDTIQAVAKAVGVLVVAGPAQAFCSDVDVVICRAHVLGESQVVVELPEPSQHLLSLLVGWVDVGQHSNYVLVYHKGRQSLAPTVNSVMTVLLTFRGSNPKSQKNPNFGFAYSYKPEYEAAQGTFEWRHLQTGFVHETAHYFWTGNEDWIDEGLANIVEYQFSLQMGLSQGQLQTKRKNCEAHDLKMLSEWDPDSGDVDRFHCSYYLGQPLFQDLLASMDVEPFREKLGELYQLSLEAQAADRTPSIAEVRQAFAGQDGIIDYHWSGKPNAPENRPFDEGYERTNHDLIQWEQYPAFVDGVVELKGVLLGDSILVSKDAMEISLFEFAAFKLRSVDGGTDLGSILPPPRTGRIWILDDPGDVQATTFAVNEADRRFQIRFEFPTALGDPEDVVVLVLGYQNADREPTIGSKVDPLGYTRIRLE